MSDPDLLYSSSQNGRSPASSQPPIGDAVSSAFENSKVQQYDPDLIAQITENVIRQLHLNKTPGLSQTHAPATASATASQTSPSPPQTKPHQFSPPPRKESNSSQTKPSSQAASPKARSESFSSQSAQRSERPTRPEPLSVPSASGEETPLERKWGRLFDDTGTATSRLGQLLRGIANHLIQDFEPKQSIVVTPEKMLEFYKSVRLDKETYPWHVVLDDRESYVSRMFRDLSCQHHLVQEADHRRPDIPGLTPAGFARWMTLMLISHPNEEFERLKKAIVGMPIDNPDDKSERFPKDISRRLFPTTPDTKSRRKIRKAIERHAETAQITPFEDDDMDDDSGPENDLRSTCTHSEPFRPRRSTDVTQPRRTESPKKEIRYKPGGTGQDRIPTVGADGHPIPDDEHTAPHRPIERERKPYVASEGSGRIYEEPAFIQPAGGRANNLYPAKPASVTSSAPSRHNYSPTSSRGPPSPTAMPTKMSTLPRQSSVPPQLSQPTPTQQAGLARSNSGATKGRSGTAFSQNNGMNGSPPTEIHQSHPPPTSQRTHRGSVNRRRAPSGSQGYNIVQESAPALQSIGTDSRHMFAERASDYDAFGIRDGDQEFDDSARVLKPRNGAAIRRESTDQRKASPGKRSLDGQRPLRGFDRDDDNYRDNGAYH